MAAWNLLVDRGDLVIESVADLVQESRAGGIATAQKHVADASNKRFSLAQTFACVGQFRRCQHEILSGKAPPSPKLWIAAVAKLCLFLKIGTVYEI